MNACYFHRQLLADGFNASRQVLIALGDEHRQQIFLALLETVHEGMRVPELMARTHLSRPALSRHLKILKEAGLVEMHRIGTKNFYYAATNEEYWADLYALIGQVQETVRAAKANGYPRFEEEEQ